MREKRYAHLDRNESRWEKYDNLDRDKVREKRYAHLDRNESREKKYNRLDKIEAREIVQYFL